MVSLYWDEGHCHLASIDWCPDREDAKFTFTTCISSPKKKLGNSPMNDKDSLIKAQVN